MQRSTEADLARVQGRADLQAFLDERTARVPLGRRAEIAEIAASVVWLALDAPAYMTAARLNVSRRPRQGLTVAPQRPARQPPTSPRSRRRADQPPPPHARRWRAARARATSARASASPTSSPRSTSTSSATTRPNLAWPERDRFLLSTGHYSIALWAALAEAGILPVDELADLRRRRQPPRDVAPSTPRPGVEMIGGSLGHGLGQAVGQALGLRLDGSEARVFVELSDGEMQEGSTWEAAMSASHFRLDSLVALIDCNGIQADGADRPRHGARRRASGAPSAGRPREIDGNDMAAIVAALQDARAPAPAAQGDRAAHPARQGRAAASRRSEKAHFFRVDPAEWDGIIADFESLRRRLPA